MNSGQHRIYSYLINEILEGRLAYNSRIEPEIELGKRLGTTRMNAHRAIKHLEKRGIVSRDRHDGTIVKRRITASVARELRSDLAGRVGVVHSRNRYEFLHWNEALVKNLQSELKDTGLTLEDVNMEHVSTREQLKSELKRLTDSGFSAIILSLRGNEDSFFMDNADILFQYHRNIFVYQSGAENWHELPFHTVTVNLFSEGRIAAEYLAELGCEHIAYCSPVDDEREWSRERWMGLEFGLRRCFDGKVEAERWTGLENIYSQFTAEGKKHVLVGRNDKTAVDIIEFFRERGLTLGKDFCIMSFDDDVRYRDYELTTIAPPHEEIGRNLGELISKYAGVSPDGGTTCYLKVDSRMIKRKSL
ncbi:MAG: substrate-binding domain-containing protein [Victivallales bacterium]|nr:substrate-binding domain-containing protein [Victivallales bacterium]